MDSLHRIGVTGSRDWDDLPVIVEALARAQGTRPPEQMLLVHGQGAPRAPDGRPISWRRAMRMEPEYRKNLRGGDWLCDVAARELGWEVEMHPADWEGNPYNAGLMRNAAMVKAGADHWLAFAARCSKMVCRHRKPHGSHGTMDCLNRARIAGIPWDLHKKGW